MPCSSCNIPSKLSGEVHAGAATGSTAWTVRGGSAGVLLKQTGRAVASFDAFWFELFVCSHTLNVLSGQK